jgi:hypothetical protein
MSNPPHQLPDGINEKRIVSDEVRDGRTYNKSVRIGDPGGATESNPHPTRPFVNPDPRSIHTFDLTRPRK